MVCRGVGLETNTTAADYIALYNGDKKTLAESLAVIQETSAKILNDLLPEQRLAPSRRASTAPNPTEREQAQPNRITQHEQTISLDR